MEKELKLTIIVLCYNHEKYLEEAINSIKKQKCNFNYEIIIGDDASTDNSQAIIRKITKDMANVTLVLRKKNIGATNNLYDLYMRSKGKYIIVLESDDYWLNQDKLQTQMDFLENNKIKELYTSIKNYDYTKIDKTFCYDIYKTKGWHNLV